MPHDHSPRFTWWRSPQHVLQPQETLPPIMGPFTYNAYGQDAEPLPETDASDESASGPWFQAMRYDPAQFSLDFRHRDFSPTLARWVQAEPLACLDGMIV